MEGYIVKVLIWFGCILCVSSIIVALGSAGIMLGGIPTALLYMGMFWVAGKLCRLWESRKQKKADVDTDKNNGSEKTDDNIQNICEVKKVKINKEKKVKTKYCSKCGSLVDNETKICSGCGKKYFKGLKFKNFSLAIFILYSLLIVSLILNIIQFIELQRKNEEYEYLSVNYKNIENELNTAKKKTVKNPGTEMSDIEEDENYTPIDIGSFDSLEDLEEETLRNPDKFKKPVVVSVGGIALRTTDNSIYLFGSKRGNFNDYSLAKQFKNRDDIESPDIYTRDYCRVFMTDDKTNRILSGDIVTIKGVYRHYKKTLSDCTYKLVK